MSVFLFACISKCKLMVNPTAEHKPIGIRKAYVWPNTQGNYFFSLNIAYSTGNFVPHFPVSYLLRRLFEAYVCVFVCECVRAWDFSASSLNVGKH